MPRFDVRLGGTFRIEMVEPGGSAHIAEGVVREVRPQERIVMSWRWVSESGMPVTGDDTLLTLELRDAAGGQTTLTLRHEKFPDKEQVAKHLEGWEGCLAKLPAAL